MAIKQAVPKENPGLVIEAGVLKETGIFNRREEFSSDRRSVSAFPIFRPILFHSLSLIMALKDEKLRGTSIVSEFYSLAACLDKESANSSSSLCSPSAQVKR